MSSPLVKLIAGGGNSYGQLGDSTTVQKSTPTLVSQGAIPTGTPIQQLAIGWDHTCALAGNQAYCWGRNDSGQLGDGTTVQKNTPAANLSGAIPAGDTVQQLVVSGHSTCALAIGKAYCWGWNGSGQLGDGTTVDKSTPTLVSQGAIPTGTSIQKLVAGLDYVCALAAGQVYCWGGNTYNQLGDGTAIRRNTPTLVSQGAIPASTPIQKLAAGRYHTCVLASNNQAYCWGYNFYGQLGDGTTGAANNKSTPTAILQGAIPAGATIRQLTAGDNHTCALASNNQAYCWGDNSSGRLGDGTTGAANNKSTPTAVLPLPTI